MKKIRGHYPLWRLAALEALLERQSGEGWQLEKVGRFSCRFREEAADICYRVGACEAAPGTASLAEYCLSWQKNGWQMVCQRGKLIFFKGEASAKLPEDAGLEQLLSREIHWREKLRVWFLVLAALCLVMGYAMDGFLAMRLSTIPLAVVLALSWVIDRLQKLRAQHTNGTKGQNDI